jgi:NAD(P)H-flavin reductase/ferredoxin
MFSFFSRKAPATAHINGIAVSVRPRETLLQAALRHGVDFPHSCRVGGCAACKCRLIEGKVRELTSAAYVLPDAELDQGYILACQSVPRTDVRIEVDLSSPTAAKHSVGGRVLAQTRLTHDIMHLRVQLEKPLPYKAGQFANIAVKALPGVFRSYSFATPSRSDGQVSFFVRKVPGGAFSSLINDADIAGQDVTVEGPMGDFWLRPADAPLLLVAGGSGLAPVLALLQEALDVGVKRPVTLLFGARKQADLYALETIERIAERWSASFCFIPALSDETGNSSWHGQRGMVAGLIPEMLTPGAHAYLCGPPPMVDGAVELLTQRGVPRNHIHTDRFTTGHDASVTA